MRLVACAALVVGAACHRAAEPAPAPAAASASALPAWTRGATCYEVFVRSFSDSDGDGIGDLKGLTEKLDYINDGNAGTQRDLGARCIWLMPVAESPSYHGYDVSNYYRVEPDYGTSDDFKRLVVEAHRRGIRVLVDMVLNHASSQLPAFQQALRDPASPYRGWFRWSATRPDGKGPWGQEVWHRSPVRDEYYYGVFWRGMPDLNYETPAVREEALKVARFWLDSMGVDGFRLDAVPYLVEEGGKVVGTPGTHAVLREYGAYVRRTRPGAFTVGEVWDGIERMLPYYPDQLDSYFAFDLSDALIAAARTGSAKGLLDGYVRFQREIPPGRYSPFLRNHDQTRTMTALGGDASRNRLAITLLLTLPGFPFVYYGEEIGMTGDKPDPGLRTPMQWSAAAPGAGFTRGTPWEPLSASFPAATVEAQDADAGSLLNLHRRLVHLRAADEALGSGDLVPLDAGNDAVVAYLRRAANGRAVLVVVNLGTAPLSGIALASGAGTLRSGRYAPAGLLGGPSAAPLAVGADGRITGYAPLPTLAPLTAYLFELSAGRR
ncbi:MAG TPA: alpha-amylase family glycosyl hydrolase [Gemmatimonadaceae bacterium]|nr:alpha-amylase family glycosyl hydrolase [Gemmatimonadaceae bacterium]